MANSNIAARVVVNTHMGWRVNFGGMGISAAEWHARLRTRLNKGEPRECWPWEGTMRVDNRHPTHTYYPAMRVGGIVAKQGAAVVSVRQLMWWLGGAATFMPGPVVLMCGDARCCNPGHMALDGVDPAPIPTPVPEPAHAEVLVHRGAHWALLGPKWFDKAVAEEPTMTDEAQTSAEIEAERQEYADLQAKVQALDTYLAESGTTGPVGIQVVLLWAGMVLRDQAAMPELGQACYETAKAVTQLFQARMEVALDGDRLGGADVPTETSN